MRKHIMLLNNSVAIYVINLNVINFFLAIPGFKFSEPMKEKAVVWNEKTLNDYLEFPQKFIPGTKKAFFGVKKAEDRRDLIAFLATLK